MATLNQQIGSSSVRVFGRLEGDGERGDGLISASHRTLELKHDGGQPNVKGNVLTRSGWLTFLVDYLRQFFN